MTKLSLDVKRLSAAYRDGVSHSGASYQRSAASASRLLVTITYGFRGRMTRR